MSPFTLFRSAVCAGFAIGLGGAVYLQQTSKALGALLFTIGLFAVCECRFHLFTGKVCYARERSWRSYWEYPVILGGNFIGAGLMALLLSGTRLFSFTQKAAAVLIAVKNADRLGSLFILGFLCNIFVFLAVEGYRSFPHAIGKYAAIFLGIAVFILSGYEHSIADMFYYFTAGAMDLAALGRILVIALGNTCGGLISHEAVQFARRAQK